MKNLQYSLYENNMTKKTIYEGNSTMNEVNDNIDNYEKSNEEVNENKAELTEKINDVLTNPGYRIDYDQLNKNENIEQLDKDIHSVMLQDKFVLAMSGIALASLIVFAYKI